ncbi:MAG TPA: hypothetical protein DHW82_03915 [Spirochaetia bacterium]|nr:MAG: hypothetical protein A2Y41_02500 [Spirochaetes bacterium GWB1_36_13]HCL56140.1 hypothetical protein [Spirochaetia bacterium]
MGIKTEKILSGLQRKGFVLDSGSHHKYLYYFLENGKKTAVYTYLSHSLREYEGNLISFMKKQLGLSSMKELKDLIECPLSRKSYESILKAKCLI